MERLSLVPRRVRGVGARSALIAALLLIGVAAYFPIALAADSSKTEEPTKPAFRPPRYALYGAGREVFEYRCAICHGVAGDGKGEMAASLPVKPRSFRQGIFKYRTTPSGKMPTDDDLRRTITGGINGTAMGVYSMLTDDEVTAVIEYVKFFSRRWRNYDNYAMPIEFPAEPKWLSDSAAAREHGERGKTLYAGACAACHGADADGHGIAAAGLKDAWDSTVVPSDLHERHLRCGDKLSDVYRVLTLGVDGTPMPSFESLTPEQRWDLVAYIGALRATK